MKSGSLEGSELPSMSETRLPLLPVVRAALPIPRSVSDVSDSAVERETPSRQRISSDSDIGSSSSPRHSKHCNGQPRLTITSTNIITLNQPF